MALGFISGPLGPLSFDIWSKDFLKAMLGIKGYKCTKYGPCGYCHSFTSAKGDRRNHLDFILGALGPWALICGAQTTQRRCRGLWATSLPCLCSVAIGDFLLEVTEKRVLRRRRRRRTRQLQNIYACTSQPVYLWCWNEQACRSRLHCVAVGL